MWSSRHPDIIAAHIDVHPDQLRRGIGTRLLETFESVADRPITWNIEPSGAADGFLTTHGFAVVVTSVTARIQADLALAELERRPVAMPLGVTTQTVVALSADLIELYDEIYAHCHQWAGSYTPPAEAPWIHFAGPVLQVAGSIQVAYDDVRPCAVASLHTGAFAEGANAFLAPTAVLAGSADERLAILATLLCNLLAAAIRAGMNSINIEYDTTYPELGKLAECLPSTLVEQRHVWMRR